MPLKRSINHGTVHRTVPRPTPETLQVRHPIYAVSSAQGCDEQSEESDNEAEESTEMGDNDEGSAVLVKTEVCLSRKNNGCGNE